MSGARSHIPEVCCIISSGFDALAVVFIWGFFTMLPYLQEKFMMHYYFFRQRGRERERGLEETGLRRAEIQGATPMTAPVVACPCQPDPTT